MFAEWEGRFFSKAQRDGKKLEPQPRLCRLSQAVPNAIRYYQFWISDFTLLALIDTRKLKQQTWSKCWLRKGKKYSFLIYLVLFKNRLFLFYLRNMENILIIDKSFWNTCLSISHLKGDMILHEFKPPTSNLLSFLLHCYLQSQEGKIKKNLKWKLGPLNHGPSGHSFLLFLERISI